MRLINVTTLGLEEFYDDEVPPYAILSHRWQAEEVLFRDMENGTASAKKGFHKLQMACKETARDGISYIWIDTCCIDKNSSAELSEAINSMYRYYQEADRCYAYLYDVDLNQMQLGEIKIEQSVWFTRAWTLQELLAPRKLTFYDREWRILGTKQKLLHPLAKITGIPTRALAEEFRPNSHSIAQRMSWAAHRNATRKEDLAYSLFGIFDVNMPMLYGEGGKAFLRLQEEIIKRSADQSILAWSSLESAYSSEGRLLANSPAEFRDCGGIYPISNSSQPFAFDNIGLNITLPIIPWTNRHLALLDCKSNQHCYIGIFLKFLEDRKTCERELRMNGFPKGLFELEYGKKTEILRPERVNRRERVTIRQFGDLLSSNKMYSFEMSVILRRMERDCKSREDLRIWYMGPKEIVEFQKLFEDSDVSTHFLTFGLPSDTLSTAGILIFPSGGNPERTVRIKLGFDSSSEATCCVQLFDRKTNYNEPPPTRFLDDFDPAWTNVEPDPATNTNRWEISEGMKREWIFRSNYSNFISNVIREIGLHISITKFRSWDVEIKELGSLNGVA